VATLAAQLWSVAHVATVAHATCAEHGESVELLDSGGDGHHCDGPCITQSTSPASHHDHCAAASFRRERSTATPLPACLRACHDAAANPELPFASPTPSPIPILFVAPKNSPPKA